jgi:hypothetical protein
VPCCYDLAQRLKRVFNIDIAVCGRCVGSVKVIVGAPNRCIKDQDIIDRILAHLKSKEQNTPRPVTPSTTDQSVTEVIASFRWEEIPVNSTKSARKPLKN